MWHEARKQERLIRGMIVDYRRRAERRRDFYEKINADSTQILQVHGRPCKIHLEPTIAAAGDSASIMMPWQGDHNNIIDRFDVRAHLDYIPEVKTPDVSAENLSQEERNCNYERYRILAQNLFLGISEEKFLHQLAIEEQFGITVEEKETHKEKLNEKKGQGASIGYNYDNPSQSTMLPDLKSVIGNEDKDDSDEESDVEIMDVDLSIDVNKVEATQAHAMNVCGSHFGMLDTDLFSFLTGDAQEAERHRQQMREEKEKALFSGRKSRRQRRAHRDKLLATRVVSPPHYAARPSPVRHAGQESPSPTRSLSPPEPTSNSVTYITSFGGDDDLPAETGKTATGKMSYADKLKLNNEPKTYASVLRENSKKTFKRLPSPKRSNRSPYSKSRRSRSRNTSRSRSSRSRRNSRSGRSRPKSYRSRSRSRTRSRSRDRRRSYSDRSSKSYSRERWSSRSSQSRSTSQTSSTSSSDRSRKGSNKINNINKSPDSSHTINSTATTPAPVVRPSYYGRKREGYKSSSSELSLDSSDDQSNTTEKTNENMVGSKTSQVSNVVRSTGSASKQFSASSDKLSLKERLRRKMQAQLSRQLRADKKAEAERLEREQQMQQERDDEMREMAIKIRRRQREMRHQRNASYSSPDGDSSSSSPAHSPPRSPPRSPRYNRKRSVDREDRKKYDDSPPRRLREKDKDFSNLRVENSHDRDKYLDLRNQDEKDMKYNGRSTATVSGPHNSKTTYGNRNSHESKDYDVRNVREYKNRDYDSKNRETRKENDKSSSYRRHRDDADGNESSKAPMRRLVDY